MIYTFTLNLPPTAKGRPRVAMRGKGDAARPTMYTPPKTVSFEAAVAHAARAAMGPVVLEGPIRLDMLLVLPRPGRLMRKSDPSGLVYAPKKPDRDNMEKAVMDGMSSCWRDDAQVVRGEPIKVYAEKNGRPRTMVRVEVLDEGKGLPGLLDWIVRPGPTEE
ncbi:MAG: hypothetical protein AMXMBFR64_60790 [Myxococcales bacterium]